MRTTAPMNTSVNTVPTFATYHAAAISTRMTRVAPSMLKPSIRECANYSSRTPAGAWNGSPSGVERIRVQHAALLDDGMRILAVSAGLSAGVVRVARERRAGPGRGVGLWLWQRPGQRAAGRAFFAGVCHRLRRRTDRRREAAPTREVLGGARGALQARRGLGRPGDRGAGAA